MAAHRALSGSRLSDGFNALKEKRRLDLTLEALAVDSATGQDVKSRRRTRKCGGCR